MRFTLLLFLPFIVACTPRSNSDLRGKELYWSYLLWEGNRWDPTQAAVLHAEDNYAISAKLLGNGKMVISGLFQDYRSFGPPSDRREMNIDSIHQGYLLESCEVLVREDDGEWNPADSVTAIDNINIPEFDTLRSKRLGYKRANETRAKFEDLPQFLRRGGVTHQFHFTPFTGQEAEFLVRAHFKRQNGTSDSVSKRLQYQWRLAPLWTD